MDSKIDTLVKTIKNRTNKITITCNQKNDINSDDNLKLSDNIIVYSCGENEWKIISLDIMLRYPILYDKYKDEDGTHDITVIVCPLTLQSTIFFGLLTIETYNDYKMILYNNQTRSMLSIDAGNTIDENNIISKTKRIDVKIMTFRDAIIMVPDACVGYTTDNLENLLISSDYYKNNYDFMEKDISDLLHPKTLTYIIQYRSLKGHNKFSILLGKDASQSMVTGYNVKKSGTLKYMSKYKNKIINRNGYLMPMLWYMAKNIYPQARVVYIY